MRAGLLSRIVNAREERLRSTTAFTPQAPPTLSGTFFQTDFSLLDPVGAPTVVSNSTLNDSNQAWRVAQTPQVLGFTQPTRITVHDHADGPAAANPDRYLRFELRPFHNSDRTLTVIGSDVPAETGTSTVTLTGDLSGVNTGTSSAFAVTAAGERVRFDGIAGTGPYTVQLKRQRPNGTAAATMPVGSTMILWGGDVNSSGGNEDATSRCEVYNKSTQWYHFGQWTYIGFWMYVDSSTQIPTGSQWVELSQISKGDDGGSPPIAFGMEDGSFRLAAVGVGGPKHVLQSVVTNQWHYWQFGVKHHTDPTLGKLTVWKDGAQLGSWTQATVDNVSGHPDPTYNKYGVYRQSSMTGSALVYFGPVKSGWTLADSSPDALVETSGPTGDFSWKGYNWYKRTWAGAPGVGTWSASNVIGPDSNGWVTFRLASQVGAEINSTRLGFGYGTYWITTNAPLSGMAPNAVWGGLFTYDNNTAGSHNEIDICETSAWGGSTVRVDNTYFLPNGTGLTVYPSGQSVSTVAPGVGDNTYAMKWEPAKITWSWYIGSSIATGTLKQTAVTTTNIPTPGTEQLCVNVWPFGTSAGSIDVVVKDIGFRSIF